MSNDEIEKLQDEEIQPIMLPKKVNIDVLFTIFKDIFSTYDANLENANMSNMAEVVDKYCRNIKERIINQKKLDEDIIRLSLFLDFSYSYYIEYYSKKNNIELVIKEFPKSIPRLKFLHKLVKSDNDFLLNLFIECNNNNFIYDITNKQVPFDLITELTTDEVEEKIGKIIFPLFKDILNELCNLRETIQQVITDTQDELAIEKTKEIIERLSENTVIEPTDITETTTENTLEQPVENTVEKITEQIIEQIIENITETTTENTVEPSEIKDSQ
jgi:L-lactate utilization protein LutC